MAITHQDCEIRIPSQNNINGVAYNTIVVENDKHAITLTATAKGFTASFEASGAREAPASVWMGQGWPQAVRPNSAVFASASANRFLCARGRTIEK